MTISVSLIRSWTSFLMESAVMYIWWSFLYIKRFSDSAYDGRWFWISFHNKGSKEEPRVHPLVWTFHALCMSCSFTWFLLSFKKDRIWFKNATESLEQDTASQMLCSYEWIIQSYFPSRQKLFSNPQQALLKLSRNNIVFYTRPEWIPGCHNVLAEQWLAHLVNWVENKL